MPKPDKLVLVENYTSRRNVEERLNSLANDPTNRYDLKFFTESSQNYTIVLIWTPPETT